MVKFLFYENIEEMISADLSFEQSLKMCLIFSFFYLLFDGLRWLVCGFLIAAGDTFFLLIFGSLSVWFFLLIPVYLFVVKNNLSVEYAWGITMAYSILTFAIYMLRFLQGKWKQADLFKNDPLKA